MKSGVVIAAKMIISDECNNKTIYDIFNNQINKNNEFEAHLYLLRGQSPNQFGQMLPYKKNKT